MKTEINIASLCAIAFMFFAPTIASAGEWGKTSDYKGSKWRYSAPAQHGPVSRASPSANTRFQGGTYHCYNCGTIATPQGKVLSHPPTHGRRMPINRTYREFHGRAPILRGFGGVSILFGIHDWRRGYYGTQYPEYHVIERF